MKRALILAVASLLAVAVVAGAWLMNVSEPHATHPPKAAHSAAHSAAHAHAPAGKQAPAVRWQTDAPLRTGMANIRTSVEALGHLQHGHLDDGQVVALATHVEQQIAYLVANCKLEPQADAALHTIIAELGAAAQTLKLKRAADKHSAIASMRRAVASYPQQFDDPTWVQGEEPEEAR